MSNYSRNAVFKVHCEGVNYYPSVYQQCSAQPYKIK
jgi:hypothetical protein